MTMWFPDTFTTEEKIKFYKYRKEGVVKELRRRLNKTTIIKGRKPKAPSGIQCEYYTVEGLCRLVSRSSSEIEICENEIMKLEGGE